MCKTEKIFHCPAAIKNVLYGYVQPASEAVSDTTLPDTGYIVFILKTVKKQRIKALSVFRDIGIMTDAVWIKIRKNP